MKVLQNRAVRPRRSLGSTTTATHDCQQAPIRWSCGRLTCDLSPVLQNTWQWLQRARKSSILAAPVGREERRW
eukprot:1141115-Prymnesium_polylepis.1